MQTYRHRLTATAALLVMIGVITPMGLQWSQAVPPALHALDRALGRRFPALAAVQALLGARQD